MNFEGVKVAGDHPPGALAEMVCVTLSLLVRRQFGAVRLPQDLVERAVTSFLFDKDAGALHECVYAA